METPLVWVSDPPAKSCPENCSDSCFRFFHPIFRPRGRSLEVPVMNILLFVLPFDVPPAALLSPSSSVCGLAPNGE